MKKKKKDNDKAGSSPKKAMREASLQEIGNELGLTRMRICQLEKIILEKLRKNEKLQEHA
jgi:DNA-directed RNA polymerase sigma subunit (sigma70/sigma32)